jgi:hypothetical protein
MTTASILDRLDPVKVELLIAHLAEHFRGKVLPKEDSTVMRGVAEAFDVGRLLGIVPGVPGGDVFLRDYATTIGPFVFIPRAWTPRQRLLVVLHELCHVVQFWSAPWGFPVLYLSQPEARAAFEAQAYRAEPEAIYVLEGRTYAIDTSINKTLSIIGQVSVTNDYLELSRAVVILHKVAA